MKPSCCRYGYAFILCFWFSLSVCLVAAKSPSLFVAFSSEKVDNIIIARPMHGNSRNKGPFSEENPFPQEKEFQFYWTFATNTNNKAVSSNLKEFITKLGKYDKEPPASGFSISLFAVTTSGDVVAVMHLMDYTDLVVVEQGGK